MCYKRTGSCVGESSSSNCRVDGKDNRSSLGSVGRWLKVEVAPQYEEFCLITVAVFYYVLLCSLSFVHFAIPLGPSFSASTKGLSANPSPVWVLLKGVVMHSHCLKMTWRC